MKTDVTPIALEQRTQAYGRRLLERLQRKRDTWTEGAESRALALLSENDRLRTRALRLVDVLPGLVPERDDALLLDLARELLGPVSRDLPPAVSLPLRAALSGALPPPVFAGLARSAVSRIGRRFIVPAGEEGRALRELRASGRLATFDVLGEAVVGGAQAEAYAARYLDLVGALARDADAGLASPGGVPRLQVSLKLSALTPRFDPADPPGTLRRLRRPLERILDAARRGGVAVTWDVEQYALRDLTWWLFQEVFRPQGPFGDWEGAGIVAQAYLRDAPAFVDGLLDFARRRGAPFQVRLVKGAYWDYETVVSGAARWPSPVCTEKWQTDAQYEALTRTLLGAWPDVHTAVASHNVRSLAHAAAVAEAVGLGPEAVEYQTLYGMDPAVSGALREMGWVARDYVPSGDLLGGMAYLVRRLLENTSQVGFLRQSRIDLDPDVLLAPPRPAPASPRVSPGVGPAAAPGRAEGRAVARGSSPWPRRASSWPRSGSASPPPWGRPAGSGARRSPCASRASRCPPRRPRWSPSVPPTPTRRVPWPSSRRPIWRRRGPPSGRPWPPRPPGRPCRPPRGPGTCAGRPICSCSDGIRWPPGRCTRRGRSGPGPWPTWTRRSTSCATTPPARSSLSWRRERSSNRGQQGRRTSRGQRGRGGPSGWGRTVRGGWWRSSRPGTSPWPSRRG